MLANSHAVLSKKFVLDLDTADDTTNSQLLVKAFEDETITDIEMVQNGKSRIVKKADVVRIAKRSASKVNSLFSLAKQIFWASNTIAKVLGLPFGVSGFSMILVTHLYRWYSPVWLSDWVGGVTNVVSLLDHIAFALTQTVVKLPKFQLYDIGSKWWNVIWQKPDDSLAMQYPYTKTFSERAYEYASSLKDSIYRNIGGMFGTTLPDTDVGYLCRVANDLDRRLEHGTPIEI